MRFAVRFGLVVACFVGLRSVGAPASPAGATRPNVLWICTDDHASYVTGCYGNKVVRTPNIDRLAASGIRFDRAFCNAPVCTASRQSFITGRYPGKINAGSSSKALVEFIDVVPTVLEYCGLSIPENIQGRSLVGLLDGKTDRHREHVFVEYAQNDEVMVRDERFKLVFLREKRHRTDGYDPERPLKGHTLKLYDLKNDPGEFTNLAGRPEHRERVDHYVTLLVDFLKRTSRLPGEIPETDDPMAILDHCVQPRDVGPAVSVRP